MDSQSVTDFSVFDHEGPWTEAAYLALKHDGRVEVVDGTLIIGPGPHPRRTRAIEHLREAVASALPDGLVVRGPVPLRLGPDCLLVPDLIVTSAPSSADGEAPDGEAGAAESAEDADTAVLETTVLEAAVLDAAAALMVIEVVGCDHGATDRSFKLQLYSRSRIPYSMLVDHDGPFAVADMIIGGRYHEYARAGGDENLLIEEPFRLELDLTQLAAPGPARPAPAEEPVEPAAAPTQAIPVVPTDEPDGPTQPVTA